MNETQLLEAVKSLQESQKSIKITIGSIMGLVLIIFFFTFAMLLDKAPPLFFIIETIITIIIIPLFFMLNKLSFVILKIRKGKKEELKKIIAQMNANDVDKKAEIVLQKLENTF